MALPSAFSTAREKAADFEFAFVAQRSAAEHGAHERKERARTDAYDEQNHCKLTLLSGHASGDNDVVCRVDGEPHAETLRIVG